jgi:hypothetical protein
MTILIFGGKKGEACKPEEHHPNREAQGWQHHVVAVLCCRRDWCTSQNRWHNEERTIYPHIYPHNLATSQDISQEVKAWSQRGLPNDNDPKHTSKVVAKWLKGQQSQGIGLAITKP